MIQIVYRLRFYSLAKKNGQQSTENKEIEAKKNAIESIKMYGKVIKKTKLHRTLLN